MNISYLALRTLFASSLIFSTSSTSPGGASVHNGDLLTFGGGADDRAGDDGYFGRNVDGTGGSAVTKRSRTSSIRGTTNAHVVDFDFPQDFTSMVPKVCIH